MTEHHPNWFFIKGWNERRCRCDRCEQTIYTTHAYNYPAQAQQNYFGSPLSPYSSTTTDGTNT